MALLDSMGQYLQDQTASLPSNQRLTLGGNLFLGRFPAEAPNAAVLIQQYGGGTPTMTMGSAPAVIENPKLQLLVRGEREDYPDAYQLAYILWTILSSVVTNVTIDGTNILRIAPMGMPNYIGYDDTDRPKFTINFTAMVATPSS